MVVKKDGRREAYDRRKVIAGLRKACEKRPISIETIEAIADKVEQRVLEVGSPEVPAKLIGNVVMEALHETDPVAYVRFASVYRSFKDIDEFMHELELLIKQRESLGGVVSLRNSPDDE